jgi:hypothetical protein
MKIIFKKVFTNNNRNFKMCDLYNTIIKMNNYLLNDYGNIIEYSVVHYEKLKMELKNQSDFYLYDKILFYIMCFILCFILLKVTVKQTSVKPIEVNPVPKPRTIKLEDEVNPVPKPRTIKLEDEVNPVPKPRTIKLEDEVKCRAIKMNGKQCRQDGTGLGGEIINGYCKFHKKYGKD